MLGAEMSPRQADDDRSGPRKSVAQFEQLDSLGEAKSTLHHEAALRREQNKLPAWMRDEICTGVQDDVPKGYEEMVGEYFRALAAGRNK